MFFIFFDDKIVNSTYLKTRIMLIQHYLDTRVFIFENIVLEDKNLGIDCIELK